MFFEWGNLLLLSLTLAVSDEPALSSRRAGLIWVAPCWMGRWSCSRVRLVGRKQVEKVPDKNVALMSAADNLEVIQLQPINITCVVYQCLETETAPGCPWVKRCLQIPHFDCTVVRTADDPLVVEPDARDRSLVTFQHSKTSSTIGIPYPDRIIARATNDMVSSVLQAKNASFVSVQRSDKLACFSLPHLNRFV